MTGITNILPFSDILAPARPEAWPRAGATTALRCAAGVLLLAALVVAPLDYGATRPAGLVLLIVLLGAAAICWATALAAAGRLLRSSPALLLGLAMVFLSTLPWLAGADATAAAPGFTPAHFARVVARWPASVVAGDPADLIALHAGLALALWIAADLARQRGWLIALATGIVATAVLATLLALAQNQTHAPGIFWQNEGRLPGRFWGPFFHHTTAGAYLNSAWPLAAALALMLRNPSAKLAALAAFVFLLGAQVSHIARLPSAAALVMLVALAVRLRPEFSRRHGTAAVLAAAGVLVMVAVFGQLGELGRRWRLLGAPRPATVLTVPAESTWPALVRDDLLIPNRYDNRPGGDRGEAQRTALRAIAARPLVGHGPGSWGRAASHFSTDPYVRSFYLYLQFAHEDFLQAWVEWGAAGFGAMILLLPGALFAGWRSSAASSVLTAAAAAGVGGILLQSLLDFPLQIPAIALNACVLAGLAWSAAGPAPSPDPITP